MSTLHVSLFVCVCVGGVFYTLLGTLASVLVQPYAFFGLITDFRNLHGAFQILTDQSSGNRGEASSLFLLARTMVSQLNRRLWLTLLQETTFPFSHAFPFRRYNRRHCYVLVTTLAVYTVIAKGINDAENAELLITQFIDVQGIPHLPSLFTPPPALSNSPSPTGSLHPRTPQNDSKPADEKLRKGG